MYLSPAQSQKLKRLRSHKMLGGGLCCLLRSQSQSHLGCPQGMDVTLSAIIRQVGDLDYDHWTVVHDSGSCCWYWYVIVLEVRNESMNDINSKRWNKIIASLQSHTMEWNTFTILNLEILDEIMICKSYRILFWWQNTQTQE